MQLVKIEKMPKAIQEIVGGAQKKLNIWEDEARKTITGTYDKVKTYPSVMKMEQTIDGWRTRYANQFNIDPIRKKVEKFSADVGNKAFSTIGVATKTDIQTITRKINRLRGEIRKLVGKKTTRTK
jgi:polyhydroxyalkanoate synthesis regulator phasin